MKFRAQIYCTYAVTHTFWHSLTHTLGHTHFSVSDTILCRLRLHLKGFICCQWEYIHTFMHTCTCAAMLPGVCLTSSSRYYSRTSTTESLVTGMHVGNGDYGSFVCHISITSQQCCAILHKLRCLIRLDASQLRFLSKPTATLNDHIKTH